MKTTTASYNKPEHFFRIATVKVFYNCGRRNVLRVRDHPSPEDHLFPNHNRLAWAECLVTQGQYPPLL
jgi:hypothetical protein